MTVTDKSTSTRAQLIHIYPYVNNNTNDNGLAHPACQLNLIHVFIFPGQPTKYEQFLCQNTALYMHIFNLF